MPDDLTQLLLSAPDRNRVQLQTMFPPVAPPEAGKIGPGQPTAIDQATDLLMGAAGVPQVGQAAQAIKSASMGDVGGAVGQAGLLGLGLAPMMMGIKSPFGGDMASAIERQGIRAYHVSPYDVDKFDLSKVGTGQGQASFGHGIYAAESPAVSGPAGHYDLEFTAKKMGKYDLNLAETSVLKMLRAGKSDMDIVGELANQGLAFDAHDAISILNNVKAGKAKIYDLAIHADPAMFLDWDRAMSQQSPEVQRIVRPFIEQSVAAQEAAKAASLARGTDAFGRPFKASRIETLTSPPADIDAMTGKTIYFRHGLPATTESEGYQKATRALNEGGIPGIRYADADSRAMRLQLEHGEGLLKGYEEQLARDPNDLTLRALRDRQVMLNKRVSDQFTNNYVVFDPKLIEILRKYGIVGPVAAGTGVAAGYDR